MPEIDGVLFVGGTVSALHAEEDADDVAVNEGRAFAVSHGRNGTGGVGADAGDGAKRGDVAWHRTAMFCQDRLRGGVERPRAAVVAEAQPERPSTSSSGAAARWESVGKHGGRG